MIYFSFFTSRATWQIFAIAIALIAVVCTSDAVGQDERNDFNSYLTKLDANRNEMLEPDELNNRAKGFLKNLEFDTDRPISIKKILRKLGKAKKEEEKKDKTPVTNNSTRMDQVDGFGTSDGGRPVSAFGRSEVQPATSRFSESVLNQVEETLGNYDLNKDRILDASEIKRARWGNPEPSKSDTNRDGKLTYTELANRYFAREQVSQESEKNKRGKKNQPRIVVNPPSLSNSFRSQRGNRTSPNRQVSRDRRRPNVTTNVVANANSAEARKKYATYAKSLIKNYDKDGDGNLSQTEVKAMRRPPVGADLDGNGFITEAELVDNLSGTSRTNSGQPNNKNEQAKSTSPTNARSNNKNSRTRTVQAGGSFKKLDTNGDNQVEMHEYASDWDDRKAAEFFEKDKNRDGVITAREWNSR